MADRSVKKDIGSAIASPGNVVELINRTVLPVLKQMRAVINSHYGNAIEWESTADAPSYYCSTSTEILLVDASSYNAKVYLPNSNDVVRTIKIKKTDSSVNTVTIYPDSGQGIEGASSKILTSQYDGVALVPYGDTWWIY